MKLMHAYSTVEAMANGTYIATASGHDLEFVNSVAKYWSQAGYWTTIHCTNSKGIRVVEPAAALTIVNKPKDQLKVYRVCGDYCMKVVAAHSAAEAEFMVTHFDDGEERGYPWAGAKAYEDEETDYIVGTSEDAYVIAQYIE
jgi:hypothetical protein